MAFFEYSLYCYKTDLVRFDRTTSPAPTVFSLLLSPPQNKNRRRSPLPSPRSPPPLLASQGQRGHIARFVFRSLVYLVSEPTNRSPVRHQSYAIHGKRRTLQVCEIVFFSRRKSHLSVQKLRVRCILRFVASNAPKYQRCVHIRTVHPSPPFLLPGALLQPAGKSLASLTEAKATASAVT